MPPSFRPSKTAVQTYVPSDKNGILKSVQGDNFERLPTYHASIMLREIGDEVVRASSLMSFAAFVWLIGDAEDVKRDAMRAIDEFKVEVETAEDA
mmetsp:Transcript_38249/g.67131  ORF Transcript_38249/g.67131 Transcript_38249/m.67131 type:complete len:95 (-) Transcript_38249:184-468(-)